MSDPYKAYSAFKEDPITDGEQAVELVFSPKPPKTQLVLEFCSVRIRLPHGQHPAQLTLSDTTTSHFLIGTPKPPDGPFDVFVVSQRVRFYSQSPITVAFFRDPVGSGFVAASISGYLIDVP